MDLADVGVGLHCKSLVFPLPLARTFGSSSTAKWSDQHDEQIDAFFQNQGILLIVYPRNASVIAELFWAYIEKGKGLTAYTSQTGRFSKKGEEDARRMSSLPGSESWLKRSVTSKRTEWRKQNDDEQD